MGQVGWWERWTRALLLTPAPALMTTADLPPQSCAACQTLLAVGVHARARSR